MNVREAKDIQSEFQQVALTLGDLDMQSDALESNRRALRARYRELQAEGAARAAYDQGKAAPKGDTIPAPAPTVDAELVA